MIGSRQKAYLDAMDIPLWELRCVAQQQASHGAEVPGLKLGPGNGAILLICAADTEAASKLSNDISRTLESVPVWAWPASDEAAISPTEAVDKNLFTTVAVFGEQLARQFFGSDLPARLNSASLLLLPAMQDLEARAEARRELWQLMCRSGMIISAVK